MRVSKTKLQETGAALFTRNHRIYVERAAEKSDRMVTFRAARAWRSAKRALDELGSLRLYLACNGGGPQVEYVADLVHVELDPVEDNEYTENLLGFQLPETKGEGLWEQYGQRVKTLYVLRGCQRLKTPLAITALVKLTDGEPIAEDYRYSYSLVHPEPKIAEHSSDHPDEVPAGRYAEGAVSTVRVNRFERAAGARDACLQHYGHQCFVCEMLLEDLYGEAAKELVHVHHLVPLSQVRATYTVDPVKDLRPVCPNCHAVIHRAEPPYPIEEVRGWLLEKGRKGGS